MTKTVAAIIWFAGLVGWYIIRHPFGLGSTSVGIEQTYFGTFALSVHSALRAESPHPLTH